MCIFAKPVESVTDTNLFASRTDDGWQNLVYQMVFKSKDLNAMILPLPVADNDEDAVKFVSLKQYPDFFKDLNKGFPNTTKSERSKSRSLQLDSAKPMRELKVHEVGDFVASFVPSLNDFSRLDKQFVIPKQTWDKIPAYAKFGFAVFQLKELAGKPHPIAFRFKSSLKRKIFFPTIHIHDGEVHQRESFDHTLYVQNQRLDALAGRYKNSTVVDRNTGWIRSYQTASRFTKIEKTEGMVQKDQLVHRKIMKGTLKNEDVVLNLARYDGMKKTSMGMLGWLAPASLAAFGFGWLVNRRNQLRMVEAESELPQKN